MSKYEIKTLKQTSKYETVAKIFELNFQKKFEKSGAQLCIYENEKKVLDMYGRVMGESYNENSIQRIASSGKIVTNFIAAYLVDQGKLAYENSLTDYFPEFEQSDFERREILVEDVLRHDAGLAYIDSLKEKMSFDLLRDEGKLKEHLSKKTLFWNNNDLIKSNKSKQPIEKSLEPIMQRHMNEVFKSTVEKTTGEILREDILPLIGESRGITCGNSDEHAVAGRTDSILTMLRKFIVFQFSVKTPALVKKTVKHAKKPIKA
eukprot:snap_masked-scaffold_6-processed-gene-11.52-mRNA-1 protein AED:1.00 eAED:1.00 QI:0/0/0/0/1/1/3/0/261